MKKKKIKHPPKNTKKEVRLRYQTNSSPLVVAQTNALTNATYKMSVGAKRLMIMLLAQVEQRNKKPSPIGTLYIISAKDYALTCGIDESVAYKQLKLASRELMQTLIVIDLPNQEKQRVCTLSHWAEYPYSEGYIELAINPMIEPHIYGFVNKFFTQYKMFEAVKFKRFYTIRLYELLMQFDGLKDDKKKIKFFAIELEELKKILEIEKQKTYKVFGAFNRYVIKPSIAEIEEKTDLRIKLTTIRRGRKIFSLRFDFNRDAQGNIMDLINVKKDTTAQAKSKKEINKILKNLTTNN